MALACALPALAAEFVVDNTDNSGTGSLRQAIKDLNLLGAVEGELHRIVFDDALADGSTIALLTPLDDIAVDVEIDASDVLDLSVQGNSGSTFLRTDTPSVTLIDFNLGAPGSIIAIGGSDDLRFDTSDGPYDVDVLVSSDIRDATTQGGALVKEGLGTLELSGANTYSGGTYVDEGTLIVTGTPPTDGIIEIAESATLELEPAADFTLNGELSGGGELVTRNADVELLGGGEFTGLTRVQSGTLTDPSGVIQGDVELGDAGLATRGDLAFEVEEDETRTHSGDISGSGDVYKWGAGSLTLLGSNTYDGDTYLAEGALIGNSASLPGYIEASADGDTTLIFDQSFAGSFAGDIWDDDTSGFGLSLEKRGAGTLTLSGDVTASAGTTISQGRLIVDLFLDTPSTAVSPETVLGGAGSITGGSVVVEGTVSPGSVDASGVSQIGSLEVASIDFQPGSVFEVDVSDTVGDGDNLDATGNASLGSGSILRVVPALGTYAAPVRHWILGARSVTGSFTFETDFFRLDVWCDATPTPGTCGSADGQNLFLWIQSNGATWSSGASTPNQLTVGQLLDAEEPGAAGDLASVFQALQVIPANQVEPMLDAIGGEPLSAFPTAQLAIAERLNRVLHRRARDAVWGESDALYDVGTAAASPVPAAGPLAALPALDAPRAQTARRSASLGPLYSFQGDTGVGAWLDGWGVFGDLEGDGNSADVETRSFGTTLGLDYRVGERVVAGLAGGYARADIDLDGRATEGEVQLAQGAAYAGYVDRRFHVSVSGRYGHGWNDSERRIAFSGFDRKAKATFHSWDAGARAEIGANALRLGPLGLAPLAAFDWARLEREDFTERGAGSLDLVVEEDSLSSLLSSAGGSLRSAFDLEGDVSMAVELRGFWLHEFGDVERAIRARLAGAAVSGSFEIVGAELPRDRILAGLGWSASIGDVVRVFADYDVGIGSGLLQHEVALTVRMHF